MVGRLLDPAPKDRAPKDPKTRRVGTQGPGTQQSSSVALSFYDRNATCVNVLSSNVQLYPVGGHKVHIVIHTVHVSSHQIHTIC